MEPGDVDALADALAELIDRPGAARPDGRGHPRAGRGGAQPAGAVARRWPGCTPSVLAQPDSPGSRTPGVLRPGRGPVVNGSVADEPPPDRAPLRTSIVVGVVVALLLTGAGAFYAFSQQRSWVAESMVVVLPVGRSRRGDRGLLLRDPQPRADRGHLRRGGGHPAASSSRPRTSWASRRPNGPLVSTEVSVVPDTSVILIRSTAGDAAGRAAGLPGHHRAGGGLPRRADPAVPGRDRAVGQHRRADRDVAVGAGGGRADGRAGGGPGRAAGRLPPVGCRPWARGPIRSRSHEPEPPPSPARSTAWSRPARTPRRRGGASRPPGDHDVGPTAAHRIGPAPTSAPLRIVLVEFLPSGGMFQFSFQFAAALARAGHAVTLLTGPDPELTTRVEGLQVESVLPTWHPNADPGPGRWGRLRRVGRALRLLESWRRVLGQLRRERPDVAQFGELRFLLDSAALAVVARLVRPTTVVDVAHNPLPYNVHDADQSVEKTGRLTRPCWAGRTRRAAWSWCWGRDPSGSSGSTSRRYAGWRSAATATTPGCSSPPRSRAPPPLRPPPCSSAPGRRTRTSRCCSTPSRSSGPPGPRPG